jgi:hypothetical protein
MGRFVLYHSITVTSNITVRFGLKLQSLKYLVFLLLFYFCITKQKRMKKTVTYDVASYSLLETAGHFRSAYCLHHQGNKSLDD